MTSLTRIAVLAFMLCLPLAAWGQNTYVPLEQRLSPEQFHDTGLDQLSEEQLRRLNALLRDDRAAQVAAVRKEVEREADRGGLLRRDREPAVTKITGEFRGWSNGTRFQLENGQVWRVIDTPEYYVPKSKYLVAPAVALTPGLLGGWYLQVEGQSPRAKVQQVK
jgi:hypothetical protein